MPDSGYAGNLSWALAPIICSLIENKFHIFGRSICLAVGVASDEDFVLCAGSSFLSVIIYNLYRRHDQVGIKFLEHKFLCYL